MMPQDLARIALSRLPRPYTAEVILHVFCEIERTPRLRLLYDQLVEASSQASVNTQIGRSIRSTLKAGSAGRMRDVGDVCEIVKYPSLLVGIDSDWR